MDWIVSFYAIICPFEWHPQNEREKLSQTYKKVEKHCKHKCLSKENRMAIIKYQKEYSRVNYEYLKHREVYSRKIWDPRMMAEKMSKD